MKIKTNTEATDNILLLRILKDMYSNKSMAQSTKDYLTVYNKSSILSSVTITLSAVCPRLVTSVFLLLMLMSSVTCKCKGKKCKIGVILENYKAVMFDELRSLKNITGISENNEMLKHPKMFSCRSNKEQKILRSIYCMTVFLKGEVNCTATNDIDSALCKINNQMESVIKCHCNKVYQQLNRSTRCSTHQSSHKKRGKKHRKVKTKKGNKEQLRIISNFSEIFKMQIAVVASWQRHSEANGATMTLMTNETNRISLVNQI
ncbi:uncharacterized protein [Chiloscyllium punctatum]|uniref:uncharacterized protein n=1 Tax=Chiloscyllium punctatum TaxID=137246 RepID=UPI003B63EACA